MTPSSRRPSPTSPPSAPARAPEELPAPTALTRGLFDADSTLFTEGAGDRPVVLAASDGQCSGAEGPVAAVWRRLRAWTREDGPDPKAVARAAPVELPWRHRWYHWLTLPRRGAFARARQQGAEMARRTLGEPLWEELVRNGHLDVPSRRHPGVAYRLRVGHRVEVRCAPGADSPWRHPYLCVAPAYPLPAVEFLAHLYLYLRDREDLVARVAVPQPCDGGLPCTF